MFVAVRNTNSEGDSALVDAVRTGLVSVDEVVATQRRNVRLAFVQRDRRQLDLSGSVFVRHLNAGGNVINDVFVTDVGSLGDVLNVFLCCRIDECAYLFKFHACNPLIDG